MENTRRGFLQAAGTLAVAGAAPAAAAPALPTVKFGGKHEISRMLIGANPLMGYSHFSRNLDMSMREWMTPERRIETILAAERAGITTWQLHYHQDTIAILEGIRARGSKMKVFLLSDFELQKDFSMIPGLAKMGFLGMAHHGNRTDEAYRAGKMETVLDFVKRVRDTGVMAGVSTHNPEVVDWIESKGWPTDYYMTCFYRVSRTAEEARALMGGERPLGETFLEKDPLRMTAMIQKTKKPCLGFKIIGAGRIGATRENIAGAMKFAFNSIKANDAVIVGMWPKFKDEITENCEIVRQLHTT